MQKERSEEFPSNAKLAKLGFLMGHTRSS